MRKLICAVMAVSMIFLSASCGKKENAPQTEVGRLYARDLFTKEEATEFLGYEPIQSYEDGIIKSTVRYDSQPIGKDPVIVELYAESEQKSASDIYDEFKRKHSLRADSVEVTEYDSEAFIAYPSVNIYKDGYMAVVTAGSGADDAQKEILIKAGAAVSKKLCEYAAKK